MYAGIKFYHRLLGSSLPDILMDSLSPLGIIGVIRCNIAF